MRFVIITGLSGAGKSKAVDCLEDMGYYCVDNIPPLMIPSLFGQIKRDPSIEKLAVVTDVRGRMFFSDLDQSLDDLSREGIEYRILYLEASNRTLLMRYQETRRSHPLALDGNTEKAIEEERSILENLRNRADYVIDTTGLNSAGLFKEIARFEGSGVGKDFRIGVSSFGYKYGLPSEADWILDVRFIPNPYYVESLRKLTGKDRQVKDFVLGFSETQEFISGITDIVTDLVPRYRREGKYHLNIAVGCTGGQHRSVVVAEELAKRFMANGYSVTLRHREN